MRALKFYSSVRIKVSKGGNLKEKRGSIEEVVGVNIKAKVVKNKVSSPFKSSEFKVFFDGRKVDKVDEIVDIALEKGIIPRYNAAGEKVSSGRQYKWDTEPLFLAKTKSDVPTELRKFPHVQDEILEIIANGDYEKYQQDQDSFDSDVDDEEFEKIMQEDAKDIENGTISEAEEVTIVKPWDDL